MKSSLYLTFHQATCTIHDITSDELLESLDVTEIVRSDLSSQPDMITPAQSINLEVTQQLTKIAKIAYRALNLSGLATFDFIVKVGINKTSFHTHRN